MLELALLQMTAATEFRWAVSLTIDEVTEEIRLVNALMCSMMDSDSFRMIKDRFRSSLIPGGSLYSNQYRRGSYQQSDLFLAPHMLTGG